MQLKRLVLMAMGLLYLQAIAGQGLPPKIQLLLRLETGTNVPAFLEKLPPSISEFRCADAGFGLYTCTVAATSNLSELKACISRMPGCIAVQQLQQVSIRFAPNDPLNSSQVYLNRIQAYDLWDHARGSGVNRRGDTLVVAVLDDGVDTLHPDMAANMWHNRNEIPWNGLDDDSNGYVDDDFGWNGGDSNNRMANSQTIFSGHGTEVAGVIAAGTGNGVGISGLGYNVKLMPVLCFPDKSSQSAELGVIRSMLYVYRMKKLYVSSGGTKGANVVAANFSFGLGNAFPDDSPVWCALYDSLGKAGIISAGATANNDVNVDQYGDIPSTCTSDFLIICSYTDNNDIRKPSGFSPTQIDLAAPGQDIFTTQQRAAGGSQPYVQNSGTSFSTPMVAATVAMLWSNVCDSFIRFARQDNDSALKLMKSWILNGTDKLNELKGKCLSGGRLNMLGAWQQMDQWCKTRDPVYGVKDIQQGKITVFPNPLVAGESLMLKDVPTGAAYQISDVCGKMVSGGIYNGQSIPFGGMGSGIYVLTINSRGSTGTAKIQVY